ncbi:MAG: DUF881 domain-containing protein [Nocardioides sp.]
MTDRPPRRLPGLRRWPAAGQDSSSYDAAEGGPAPVPQPRPRRSLVWRVATPLVGLLVGTLFVVSAHSSEGTDLRPGRFTDLASMVRSDASSVDALKKRVADIHQQVNLLSGSVNNKQVAKYNRESAQMASPAGLLPQIGPGVTVTLSDAPSGQEVAPGDNPNLLVVHQQDIQAVVNAMWKGGANAVTVQGQRIVGTTGIRCIGNSVQLQGVPYSQPYVIAAVGDQASIVSEIDRDPFLQVYRADAANPDVNVGWGMTLSDRVVAPAYDGLLGLSYARVIPSAGSGGGSR